MAPEKVTDMVLKVDLQCPSCYKKIKKVLCKFPQIRDQRYDEKQNTVSITVICCSPEKIRDKLCYKGGKTIKSIEIKDPPKPKPTTAPDKAKADAKPDKAKTDAKPDKPKTDAKADAKPDKAKADAKADSKPDKAKADAKPDKPPADKAKEAPAPAAKADAVPITPAPPASMMVPVPMGYPCYYDGYVGEPCYQGYGYGRPVPSYDNYGYYDYHGGNRGYNVNRYDYFNEENTTGCTIM